MTLSDESETGGMGVVGDQSGRSPEPAFAYVRARKPDRQKDRYKGVSERDKK